MSDLLNIDTEDDEIDLSGLMRAPRRMANGFRSVKPHRAALARRPEALLRTHPNDPEPAIQIRAAARPKREQQRQSA